MFTRLKTWLVTWAEHYQRREIERLHEEGCRLKKEVLELTDKTRIPLSPEERRLLLEKAKRIDPQILKQISQFDFPDLHPQSPDDTSTESP
jgi:hypothetical protein